MPTTVSGGLARHRQWTRSAARVLAAGWTARDVEFMGCFPSVLSSSPYEYRIQQLVTAWEEGGHGRAGFESLGITYARFDTLFCFGHALQRA